MPDGPAVLSIDPQVAFVPCEGGALDLLAGPLFVVLICSSVRPESEMRDYPHGRGVHQRATPEFWAQSGEDTKNDLGRSIQAKIKDLLGFRIEVELAAPGVIPRSEGKTQRVFDER